MRNPRSRANRYDETQTMREAYNVITAGIVVDTNDPQQRGRLRIRCAAFNDDPDTKVEDLPWASYATPFGGGAGYGTRGPEDDGTGGPVAYGMWAIPKVGATALVMCIDGNPLYRVWLGCLFMDIEPHTLPHGRYTYQDHDDMYASGKPEGPYSSFEQPIQPLYDNFDKAYGSQREGNYEFQSRGADFQAAGISTWESPYSPSVISDDETEQYKGKTYRQGYQKSRLHPDIKTDTNPSGENLDSFVYSLTSPGFHGFSMDDRKENCRMRMRTSAGHQIILDDTNERIYVATAEGKSWIEMDQNGNIDVYSDRRISMHAKKDINFTTDETFRVHAKKGIHMETADEFRLHANKDIHMRTEENLRTHSKLKTFIEADNDINIYSSQEFRAYSSAQMNFKTDADMVSTANPNIHLNGPPATKANNAAEQLAFWTNRVPDHEPWARVLKKDDKNNLSHEPQLPYDHKDVGRTEGDDTIPRGSEWRR